MISVKLELPKTYLETNFLSFVQMKDKMVLSCLEVKQNSFNPLKQNMFTFTTKTF